MSEAADILQAIHVRFATLDGLNAILDYEPTTAHAPPLIYSLLDEVNRTVSGSLVTRRYRFLHRLVIAWQDNPEAERTLLRYVNAIPAAIEADPYLGGTLTSGAARIVDQVSGFALIGSMLYRVLDSYTDTVSKGAYNSGI